MMMEKYRFILFMAFFWIGGCSGGEDKTNPDKSILKDQIRALEKAKEVEQVLQYGADKRRQAVDESTE